MKNYLSLLTSVILILLGSFSLSFASILSISSPIPSGTYGEGSHIPLVLSMSDQFSLQGASPTLTVAIGGSNYQATLAQSSGSSLTFVLISPSANGQLSVVAFNPEGASISDTTIPAHSLGISISNAVDSAPGVSISAPDISSTTSVQVTLLVNGPAIQDARVMVGSLNQVCNLTCTVTLPEGTSTIDATVTNIVNLTTTVSKGIVVDTQPPSISQVNLTDTQVVPLVANQLYVTQNPTLGLAFTSSDPVKVYVNAIEDTTPSTIDLFGGTNSIRLVATDQLNRSTEFSFSARVAIPVNVQTLVQTLASRGINTQVFVGSINMTGHNALVEPYVNVTLSANNATYSLSNVALATVQVGFASSMSVKTTSSTILARTGAQTVVWLTELDGTRSVFPQYESISLAFPSVSVANKTVVTFNQTSILYVADSSPVTTPHFGFAILQDSLAPTITYASVTNIGSGSATLLAQTSKPATCRVSQHMGSYATMSTYQTMSQSGLNHSYTYTGLVDGTGYTMYISCMDTNGIAMNTSSAVAFSASGTYVAPTTPVEQPVESRFSEEELSLISVLNLKQKNIDDITSEDSTSRRYDALASQSITSRLSSVTNPAKVRAYATVYTIDFESGSDKTYTYFRMLTRFSDLPSDRFVVAHLVPKSFEKKMTFDGLTLLDQQLLAKETRARDVESQEVVMTFVVEGNVASSLDTLQTAVSEGRILSASTGSNGQTQQPTTPLNPEPVTNNTVVKPLQPNPEGNTFVIWAGVIVVCLVIAVFVLMRFMPGPKEPVRRNGAPFRMEFKHRRE